MSRIVKVRRVLEYEGPEDWVERTLNNPLSIKGTYVVNNGDKSLTIREIEIHEITLFKEIEIATRPSKSAEDRQADLNRAVNEEIDKQAGRLVIGLESGSGDTPTVVR